MNPEDSAQLLSQLRDIHAAPEAPFWPPAPGWWVLAVLVLLALGWLGRLALETWRERRRRRVLLERLATLRARHDPAREPQRWLAAVNRLLKVTALRARPEDRPGPLAGEAWTGFLVENGAPGPLAVLASGPYEPDPDFDADALEQAAREWIRRHG